VYLLQGNDVSQGEIKCMIVCNATAYRESQNQGWIIFLVFDGLKKIIHNTQTLFEQKNAWHSTNKLLKKMVMGMKIGSY
jgi:hypothetical protein